MFVKFVFTACLYRNLSKQTINVMQVCTIFLRNNSCKQNIIAVLLIFCRFQFDDDVKLDEVVQLCPDNITGADFYGMCSNAWMSAARRLIAQIEKGKSDFLFK